MSPRANTVTILTSVYSALLCYSPLRMNKVFPGLWQKSRFHCSDRALNFFCWIAVAPTIVQAYLLFIDLSTVDKICNALVPLIAIVYALLRDKSGKVKMEISYEEA